MQSQSPRAGAVRSFAFRERPSAISPFSGRSQVTFPGELAHIVSERDTWLWIGLALLFAGVCLIFGSWLARAVGLLSVDARAGETIGLGLATGLIVLSAVWAAIWSGGRSAFTPAAVGFIVAIAVARRPRRLSRPGRGLLAAIGASAGFLVAIGLLYGSTLAFSPRNSIQPIENPDHTFYAVLGRDLAATGTESNLSASGFDEIPGLPPQAWYHWGEIWLATIPIKLFGTEPMAARYLVVLPVVLLAVAALSGSLVMRLARTTSPRAFYFGVVACLFLAPVPLLPGPFFSSWAFGMILGISLYGLGAVAAILALYGAVVLGARPPTWALAVFAGSVVAFMLPAHILIAALAMVGVGIVSVVRILSARRVPTIGPIWRRTIIASIITLAATVVWGQVTGHSFGSSGGPPSTVAPFNASWSQSVTITLLGAGLLYGVPIGWILARERSRIEADIYLAATVLIVIGAVLWGWRLADFNMFYLFFGGIGVFAPPLAAATAVTLLARLRAANHLRLGASLVVLSALQLTWGAGVNTPLNFAKWGPLYDRQPVPVSVLDSIRNLPTGAKLAYACRPFEEATFAQPQMLSLDLHTGRRIVPMCFQAEGIAWLTSGASKSDAVANSSWPWAPQRSIYPNAAARPSSAAVAAFLHEYGIDYIYADTIHPNSLVPDAVPIASSGGVELLRIP